MKRGTIRRRAETAVAAADWVDRNGSDAFAVGILYALADEVDALRRPEPDEDALFDAGKRQAAAGKVAFAAQVALKYAEGLGLTAVARAQFVDDAPEGDDLVADLRAIMGGARDG